MKMLFSIISLFFIRGINCMFFCDSRIVDNVFSIGHLVYFSRCGQVWTFDPRLDDNSSGFVRDWAPFLTAKRYLFANLKEDSDSKSDPNFGVLSFFEMDCIKTGDDLYMNCFKSISFWNYMTILFHKTTAFSFRAKTSFEPLGSDSNNTDLWYKTNPLLDKFQSEMAFANGTSTFWPTYDKKHPKFVDLEYVSAAFDPILWTIFVVLRYGPTYIITYTKLRDEFREKDHWPKVKWDHSKWAEPYEFEGHVIGMFYHEPTGKTYIVGEVLSENHKHNDQIYPLYLGANNRRVIVGQSPTDGQEVHSVRSFFGCIYGNTTNFLERKRRNRLKRSCPELELNGLDEQQDVQDLQESNRETTADLTSHILESLFEISNEPNVLFGLSLIILLLSLIALYLYSSEKIIKN